MTECNPNLTQRIVARAKRRIIPDWRSRINDYSTRALAVIVALAGGYSGAEAAGMTNHIPKVLIDHGVTAIAILGVLGVIGKFMTQPGADK